MKKWITIAFSLMIAFSAFAQEQTSMAEALKKAKKENKLIFIDCYFTGCIPCKQMDDNVFPNAVVKAELEKNFVFLKVDIFKDKLGDTLKVQHILNGFPTFLTLNSEGKLISSTAGYKDPGHLMAMFKEAKLKAGQKMYLDGYSAQYEAKNYPDFYVEFCKTHKGLTLDKLAEYTTTVKDFKAPNALLPYLVARAADDKAAAVILNDYKGFAQLYGEEVLQPVIDFALTKALNVSLKNNLDESTFTRFLSDKKNNFPEQSWKICLQTLGSRYFLALKKDTVGYLNFAIKNPVLYQYHFNALYSSALSRNGLTPEVQKLFCQWADAIVTDDCGLEFIKTAAQIHKRAKDEVGYNRFMKMALAYAGRYKMPTSGLDLNTGAR